MPALGRVVDHDELGSCTGNAFEMLLSHKGDATAPVPKIAA